MRILRGSPALCFSSMSLRLITPFKSICIPRTRQVRRAFGASSQLFWYSSWSWSGRYECWQSSSGHASPAMESIGIWVSICWSKTDVYNDGEAGCARGIGEDIFTQSRTVDEHDRNMQESRLHSMSDSLYR